MTDFFGDTDPAADAGLFEAPAAEPEPAPIPPASPRATPGPAHDAPLAVRMRPAALSEVVGQQHLLGPGTPLRRLVEGSGASSVLLYGPPGTGKTTLASLISGATGRTFESLSALSAGVKEVRGVIELARRRLLQGEQTVLFIDEVHRFSKTQQDALLAAVENRIVLLVAATTENPSFSVVSPLLSRSLVLQLQSLTSDDIRTVIERARTDERGLGGAVDIADDALEHLVRLASGDARRALTALEAAAGTALDRSGERPALLDLATVEASVDKAAVRYDRDGDQHYDVISAFIKSIRGSDVDAALHYLARMITAGEDPRFIARRLVVHASEDIGMADPTALQTATAAAQAVQLIGMPEARLALAQATIHLATAPKSGAVIAALGAAMADVAAGRSGLVPPHLRDNHYAGATGLGSGIGYKYPHEHPDGVLRQQYPPDELVGVDYYEPTTHGAEREIAARVGKLRRIVRGR
ncbi:replication-associated recombination protein A [Prescottella sp. R16]|uniref:replication-associated recombination protein A n=1 Tax=Prescottella sp. R16 TaxID=3064529 RepID=UPI00272E4308|nr:replication-associated recombination protein A [Prescottella sp. R16]